MCIYYYIILLLNHLLYQLIVLCFTIFFCAIVDKLLFPLITTLLTLSPLSTSCFYTKCLKNGEKILSRMLHSATIGVATSSANSGFSKRVYFFKKILIYWKQQQQILFSEEQTKLFIHHHSLVIYLWKKRLFNCLWYYPNSFLLNGKVFSINIITSSLLTQYNYASSL